jgi:phosphatidate cytidylyltransferase
MLMQRILTAIALLMVFLPAVLSTSTLPFGAVMLVLIACASWEWARLNGLGKRAALLTGGVGACAVAAGWLTGLAQHSLPLLWLCAGSLWVVLGGWLLARGTEAWLRVPLQLRLFLGIAALWVAWLAVVQARMAGTNFLMSLLALVWVADISAYFAGRTFGGRFFSRKLAPTISPGKTWEGVIGGLLGVVLCSFVWSAAESAWGMGASSLYARLHTAGPYFMVLSVLFLAAMSVVGDLVESLFKRAVGMKDSSSLLPGHGGVLDRIDALLPTVPLALMLISLVGV